MLEFILFFYLLDEWAQAGRGGGVNERGHATPGSDGTSFSILKYVHGLYLGWREYLKGRDEKAQVVLVALVC